MRLNESAIASVRLAASILADRLTGVFYMNGRVSDQHMALMLDGAEAEFRRLARDMQRLRDARAAVGLPLFEIPDVVNPADGGATPALPLDLK